ncbi:hypothetical protein T484DRAFT_1817061 [Baffinella frigidus]|nr:hypothetical protein T484DRAFT_1817061 [Cryptophyta sp. CCMP2293]
MQDPPRMQDARLEDGDRSSQQARASLDLRRDCAPSDLRDLRSPGCDCWDLRSPCCDCWNLRSPGCDCWECRDCESAAW